MKTKDLSVFFPCVNEAENIESTVKKAVRVLDGLKLNYEVIVVNDGSKDNTEEVVKKLEKENSRIRLINHRTNLGYGEALKSGFYSAKYDTICYTDGDGQFDFSEVTKFLEKIDDNDVIVGYRIKRQDPFFRILFAKGWALALFTFFRLGLKDIDCGFKMVKRSVLEKIEHLQSQRGAMINAELVIKAKKAGFRIGQVGVNHYPRLLGKPTGANIKVIIKSFVDLFKLWWRLKKEKPLFLFIVAILILAAVLRLYDISGYMTFLGDEGRDAIIVKNMITDHHFPLIGPPTSVGNVYLGPLYYYMMFASMAPFGLNPVAAAVMNAFLGVATVFLVYLLGKLLFDKKAALISAFLYTISPVVITYSRSSWNPNPAPFFALLGMLGFYRLHRSGNFNWLIVTGAAFAAAAQMHYLALILTPIGIILWSNEFLYRYFKKYPCKSFFSGTFLGIFAFFFVMSPLFWFDLRHNFLNLHAIQALLSGGSAIQSNVFENIARIPALFGSNLIYRYLSGENFYLTPIVAILVLLVLFKRQWSSIILGVWLFVGLLGLSFYHQGIYDHYLGFLSPTPFLLFGSLISFVKKGNPLKGVITIMVAILFIFLVIANIQKSPLKNPPNNQLRRTQDIAKFIIRKSGGQDLNFALLSKNNYDAAYQFYLDMYGHKAKQVPAEVTDQLFVVCEDPVCDPTHSPKYEIAGYGWSKIDWQEDFEGVKIYRLIPNPSGKP